jgi:predicted Zn-dependent peptidase
MEEMRMTYDRPMMKLYSTMHSKMFRSTPLARNIIGTKDNILHFKKKDFIEFRKQYYQPESTVIVVVGNLNPMTVYKWIERSVRLLDNSESESYIDAVSKDSIKSDRDIILQNIKNQNEPYIHVDHNKSVEQVYVILAFPLFDLYGKYDKEIELMSRVLTSGSSSRLFVALREKHGLAYGCSSYPFVYTDASIFIIRTILSPDDLVFGIQVILKELKKIKKNLIDSEELKKVKNIANNEILFSLTKPLDYLIYYGLNFLENREYKPDPDHDINKIKKIKPDIIQKLSKTIFVKPKLNIFLYGNIDKNTKFDFIKL